MLHAFPSNQLLEYGDARFAALCQSLSEKDRLEFPQLLYLRHSNMSRLEGIPVSTEPIGGIPEVSGNSLPILHEIRHGLKRLAETGESTLIDLNAIPFGPGDEARLLGLLGEGEVKANVDALGPTRIRESAVQGVWIVDYRNLDGQRLALHIEIATIPDILRTQPQDLEDAMLTLDARIAAEPGEPNADSQVRQSEHQGHERRKGR